MAPALPAEADEALVEVAETEEALVVMVFTVSMMAVGEGDFGILGGGNGRGKEASEYCGPRPGVRMYTKIIGSF